MPSTLTAPRSVRRRISRDEARATAHYGTPGHRTGPHVIYPRPTKPRPASTRSGQTRVNYKRNMRAQFLEHLIALPVSVELAEVCDVESYLTEHVGRIVRREKKPHEFRYVYRMYVPGAPAGAAQMTPIFYRDDDGTVSVQSIEWRRADGTLIHGDVDA